MSKKSEKPRILILSTAYLPLVGGSELAIKNITDRIDGVEFDMVTGRYDVRASLTEHIGAIRVFRSGRHTTGLLKIFLPLTLFFTALRLVQKNKYALVHVFQASHAGGAAWLLKRLYPQLPMLVTLQEGKALDGQSFLVRFFRKIIIADADALSVISSYLYRYARSINTRAPMQIIPNGVAVQEFIVGAQNGRTAVRKQLRIQPEEKVILSVSRLVPKNGMRNLIIAMQSVLRQHPARLVIIGAGALEDELKLLARDLHVNEHVSFVGQVSHVDLPAFLGAADVFVRPSLSEGLGTAFLEAMACGVPVIASPVGGIPDFLTDGQTGLFCNPTDPNHIAATIARLLADPELAKNISTAGQTLVREKYDWDTIAIQMRQLYTLFV